LILRMLERRDRTLLVVTVFVVAAVLAVVALRWRVDSLLRQAHAAWVPDAFGNPWYPDYAVWNARIERLDWWRHHLTWWVVLPADALLLALGAWATAHKPRWVALVTLVVAVLVAVLLAAAFIGSIVPAASMVG
jgi:hypothetical protein